MTFRRQLTKETSQVAFSNVAIIRTMQLGTENNIMTELGFSIDRYNLLATVQGVRKHHVPKTEGTGKLC
jgi:hypothetical protein